MPIQWNPFSRLRTKSHNVSHIITVIVSMLVNSFFDMEGTVCKFMEDMKDV